MTDSKRGDSHPSSFKRAAFRNACSGIKSVLRSNDETKTMEENDDGTNLQPPKKRGPGRPRKHPKPEAATSGVRVVKKVQQPPKKRGPPQHATLDVLTDGMEQQPPKKRGPGRPRKHRQPMQVKRDNASSTQEIEEYFEPRSSKVRKLSHRVGTYSSNATGDPSYSTGTMPISLQHLPDDIIFANADVEYDALWLSRADEIFSVPKPSGAAQAPSSPSDSQKPMQTKRLSFMPSQGVELQTNYFSPIRPKSFDSSFVTCLNKDSTRVTSSEQQVGIAKNDYCTPLKEDQSDEPSLVEFSWKSSVSFPSDGPVSDLPSLDVDALVAFEE